MTNDEREALIEKAAKAIWIERNAGDDAGWGEAAWAELTAPDDWSREALDALEEARAALAVFEQAHTPTYMDDGRGEELPCQECGSRNPIWFAAHPAWNLAVGGDAAREAGGILCPACFHKKWLAITGDTPTYDEREGCGCTTRQVRYVDGEWARELELIPCETHRRPVQAEPTDAQACERCGCVDGEHLDGCSALAEPTDWSRYIENPVTGEVSLAPEFRAQAEPQEVDADPDTAFELGRVAGYDEAMREMQGEPTDAQVLAALNAHYRVRLAQSEAMPGDPEVEGDAHSLEEYSSKSIDRMRAALRAAFQEGETR